MKHRVIYSQSAQHDLDKLPAHDAQRILLKIRDYSLTPDPIRFATKLSAPYEDAYRFRIRDYRAIFEVHSGEQIRILHILRVKHRKDIYRK